MLPGCANLPQRYFGSDYEKAVYLFDQGMLLEAREKAISVPKTDPSYKPALRLVYEIDELSLLVSRRHAALGDDFEKAGAYQAAIAEYNTALTYNPSNQGLKNKAAVLAEAVREGKKPDLTKKNWEASRSKKQSARRDDNIVRDREEKDDPEFVANAHYIRGKVHLDVHSYARAVEEFNLANKAVPNYRDSGELIAKAFKERDKAADEHMKRGMRYFQTEDMELAIKEWDYVLEIDPGNKTAADYRARAEVILERVKKIKAKQK